MEHGAAKPEVAKEERPHDDPCIFGGKGLVCQTMKKCAFTVCIVLAVLGGRLSWGDALVLHDGDALSGRFVRIEEGVLEFYSDYVGRIMVPVDEVQWVAMDGDMSFEFSDGSSRSGRLVHEEGSSYFLPRNGSVARPADLTAVVATGPVPADEPGTRVRVEESPPFSVRFEVGAWWRSGNTEYGAPFARLALSREGSGADFSSDFRVEIRDEDRFPSFVDANARWAGRPSDRWGPRLELGFERDTDRALELRAGLRLGVGRRLLDDADETLEVGVDLGAIFESFDLDTFAKERDGVGLGRPLRLRARGTLAALAGYERQSEGHELDLGLRFRYEREVFGRGSVGEDLVLYPSLSRFGDLRARSESTVLVSLTPRLRLKFDVLVDFEDEPGLGRRARTGRLGLLDQWQTSVGASVLWDF